MRTGRQPWDTDVTIAGREFFRAHRERDAGTYISGAFTGRATATASFALSRRRATPDGRFDGTVHVALSPQYFARFYREAAPPFAHSALLVRADGEVLARESLHGNPASPARLGADSCPLMRAIAARPEAGLGQGTAQADGRTVLFAYRRVASRPIYVVFGADREALLGRWRQNLAAYGAVAGAAALTLLLVAGFALRRERAVQAALRRAAEEGERRLAAEERLRHAGKMEALGQLAGGVAHDFNNAAAAVLAGLALIEKRHGPAIAAAAPGTVPLLAGLREGAERGAAVSRRLLAFTRREELRATAVDAAELLRGLRDLLANTLGPGIRLVVDAPPRLPPLRADPAQLPTVLINLAVNARDAMPDGGVVTLGAEARDVPPGSKLWPNDLAPGGYVRIWVTDTGVGMDRATLARATEPFFTTKARDRGTGLGLSMADGFAAQSGGALRI